MSLIGLWVGLVGAVVAATRCKRASILVRPGDTPETAAGAGPGSVVRDYGLSLRPWPDIPLGIVVGVASQYLLVPVVEAPLLPFVHHLYSRPRPPRPEPHRATPSGRGSSCSRCSSASAAPSSRSCSSAACSCARSWARFARLGPRLGPGLAIVVTGLVFALVHFEALQFLGLAGFGMVLGIPGVAHWAARSFDRRPHGLQHRHHHRHRRLAMSPD